MTNLVPKRCLGGARRRVSWSIGSRRPVTGFAWKDGHPVYGARGSHTQGASQRTRCRSTRGRERSLAGFVTASGYERGYLLASVQCGSASDTCLVEVGEEVLEEPEGVIDRDDTETEHPWACRSDMDEVRECRKAK